VVKQIYTDTIPLTKFYPAEALAIQLPFTVIVGNYTTRAKFGFGQLLGNIRFFSVSVRPTKKFHRGPTEFDQSVSRSKTATVRMAIIKGRPRLVMP
jgi:hypothetical protein